MLDKVTSLANLAAFNFKRSGKHQYHYSLLAPAYVHFQLASLDMQSPDFTVEIPVLKFKSKKAISAGFHADVDAEKVPWRLPSELTLHIFELLPRPQQSDQAEYRKHQTYLSRLCLLCKATLPAARALLLRAPLFDYKQKDSHNSRKKLLAALDRMGSRESGIAYVADSFSYINYPFNTVKKASRTSVLQSILDITSLSSVSVQQESNGNVSLYEIINIFKSCNTSVQHLKSVTLRKFTVDTGLFRYAFVFLVGLPLLDDLHLDVVAADLSNLLNHDSKVRTSGCLTPDEANKVQSSKLTKLYLSGGPNCKEDFFRSGSRLLCEGILPASIVSLGIHDACQVFAYPRQACQKYLAGMSSLQHLSLVGWPSEELQALP